MTPNDLFNLNLCNLDYLTENYDLTFYYQYLMKWPSLFKVIEDNEQIVGYSTSRSPLSEPSLLISFVRLVFLLRLVDHRQRWLPNPLNPESTDPQPSCLCFNLYLTYPVLQ